MDSLFYININSKNMQGIFNLRIMTCQKAFRNTVKNSPLL